LPPGLKPSYHATLAEARRLGLTLSKAEQQQIILLLDSYAEQLAKLVGTGTISSAPRLQALAAGLIKEMTADLTKQVTEGVRITTRAVQEAHARATLQLFNQAGKGTLKAGFFGINVRAAQAVTARADLSAAFKTIQAKAIPSVDALIREHALRGGPAAGLAKHLRIHILGAEQIPGNMLLDRRTITLKTLQELGIEPTGANLARLRAQAASVSGKAQLIARTEIMNAEQEASAMAAEESPVVKGLRWVLSNRHPIRDICNVYAERDLYGLGPGVYDPRAFPPRPHPRCLCGRIHVLREPDEWDQPKGKPPTLKMLPRDAIKGYDLPPSQLRAMEAGMRVARTRAAIARKTAGTAAAAEKAAATTAAQLAAQADAMATAHKAMATAVNASQTLVGQLKSAVIHADEALKLVKATGTPEAVAVAQAAKDLAEQKLQKRLAQNAKSGIAAKTKAKAAALAKQAEKQALELQAAKTKGVETTINKLQDIGKYAHHDLKQLIPDLDQYLMKTADIIKVGEVGSPAWFKALETEAEFAINAAIAQNKVAKATTKLGNAVSKWQAGIANKTSGQIKNRVVALQQDIEEAITDGVPWPVINEAKLAVQHLLEQMSLKEAAEKAAYEAAQAAKTAAGSDALGKLQQGLHGVKLDKSLVGKMKQSIALMEEQLKTLQDVGAADQITEGSQLLAEAKAILQKRLDQNAKSGAKHASKVKTAATATPAQVAQTIETKAATAKTKASAAASQAEALAAQTAETAVTKPIRVYTSDEILFKKISDATGSNPGGVYEGKDGIRRYVKFYEDAAQARGEVLANNLYRRLGIDAPESYTFDYKGKLAHAAELVDIKGTVGSIGMTKKIADDVLDGFVADVLTANWDAVGMSLDNIVLSKTGKVIRIDQGGSFLMRAQKSRRKDKQFLKAITEWENFNSHTNGSYSSVFSKAEIAGGNGLGERAIAQIDRVLKLQKDVGGWKQYVRSVEPSWTGPDFDEVVAMLDARTDLLKAKKLDIVKSIEAAKKAAAEAARMAKEFEERLKKSGTTRRQLRDIDIKETAAVQTKITQRLHGTQVAYLKRFIDQNQRHISGADSGAVSEVVSKVRAIRQETLIERAKALGHKATVAKQIVKHYDDLYYQWQSTTSSDGALGVKWYATAEEGLHTQFHGSFVGQDKVRQAQLFKQGENMVTGFGKYSREDMLELFRTNRNVSRALGAVSGRPTFKLWRQVHREFFDKWGLAYPKLGETGIMEHNSVSGWTWIRGSYPAGWEFEIEAEWDDVITSWWTRDNSHDGENEVWLIGRATRHKITAVGSR
jgi:hypothetical protein